MVPVTTAGPDVSGRGARRPGAGWAPVRDPLGVYRASTAQFAGVFPFTFRAAWADGARPDFRR